MTTPTMLPPVPAPEATVIVASGMVRHHQHPAYSDAHPLCGMRNHGWRWINVKNADSLAFFRPCARCTRAYRRLRTRNRSNP